MQSLFIKGGAESLEIVVFLLGANNSPQKKIKNELKT